MPTYKLLLLFLCLPFLGQAQNVLLDSTIQQIMAQNHIPGLAACAIKNGQLTWSGYYGYQNIQQNRPVTKETLFMTASSCKPITTAALMQLHAAGKFKLTDDINRYLPFRVVNPTYPHIPITFGQLLRHRSSIRNNEEYLNQFWTSNKGDPTIPLGQFLYDYLLVEGKHYDKAKNFYAEKPDSASHYCDVGFALVGYLVERIAGEPFDKYCQKTLFNPLQMTHTGWYLRDVDSTQVAMPYRYDKSLQNYIPLGHGGYPDYPAGQLRTSAEEFAHFLIAWTQQGRFANQQVLPPAIIRLITPSDVHMGFYTWFPYETNRGRVFWDEIIYCHDGYDVGARSMICFQPSTKKGVVVLMNYHGITSDGFRKLVNTIFDAIP